jgi:hypothetical protein
MFYTTHNSVSAIYIKFERLDEKKNTPFELKCTRKKTEDRYASLLIQTMNDYPCIITQPCTDKIIYLYY